MLWKAAQELVENAADGSAPGTAGDWNQVGTHAASRWKCEGEDGSLMTTTDPRRSWSSGVRSVNLWLRSVGFVLSEAGVRRTRR
jgi:hypothetical protein